jgi:excisionase family DNA binding protein
MKKRSLSLVPRHDDRSAHRAAPASPSSPAASASPASASGAARSPRQPPRALPGSVGALAPQGRAGPHAHPTAASDVLPLLSPPQKLAVSITEAARLLSISRSHLYPLVMRGAIPSFHIGRSHLIRVSALEAWIRQQEERAA